MLVGIGLEDGVLGVEQIRDVVAGAWARVDLRGKRVLAIVPDNTRTAPVSLIFHLFHELIGSQVAALDYLVALGTHPAMDEPALNQLFGVTSKEMATTFATTRLFNHRWDDPASLVAVGSIGKNETQSLSGGLLSEEVQVTINRLVFDYDLVVIVGPVFPHEVVGFSGGNKYLFPGISGRQMIDTTHWLGALITSMSVIGTKRTAVRAMIDRAASFVDRPNLCFSLVMKGDRVAGLYVGSPEEAWDRASDLSDKLHILYVDKPFQRVLSVMPEMYDDLWVAAKGMYKLEPVIADGGEVVIYAPHIDEVSYSHGAVIDEVGYHVRDYFTKQWDRFSEYPRGVLAHSTHLRGVGEYDVRTGRESPRIRVTLATGIPQARCQRINLGYLDPATIDLGEWADREDEGILLVPKAGELLYRVATGAQDFAAERKALPQCLRRIA